MNLRALVATSVVAGVLGLGVIALAYDETGVGRGNTYRQLEIFADVLAKVQSEYVSEIDDEDLIEAAVDGMLQSLDPHSSYMSRSDFENLRVQTSGEYGGLGIEIITDSGVIKIVAPIDDTPASRAGLRSGDYIVAVDGDSIVGVDADQTVELLRGPVGEPVTITVVRRGEPEPFDVELQRAIIAPKVVSHRVEDSTVGYIRISQFNEKAAPGVEDAIRDLKMDLGSSMEGLVLDLRDNPGGLLKEGAVDVSSIFLDGGEVVSTRGRRPRSIERFNAQPGDLLRGKPIVVLINEGSASAAEIVAGALQDRQRATVVGITSFGKGSVQTVIPLRNGEAGGLRLTTATYYTPAGRSIQATGITPDLEVAAERGTRVGAGMSEESLPNALANMEGIERAEEHDPMDQPPEDFPEDQDYQLKRAIDVLRGVDMAAGAAISAG